MGNKKKDMKGWRKSYSKVGNNGKKKRHKGLAEV